MQLAVVAAGFTPGEADQLRRAMAAWRRRGDLEKFRQRFIEGMLSRGYDTDLAERLFQQIQGFGEYGFPESHAASFALLVYVSSWLKCHEPAAFFCAMLNSQPMGFYAPAQLVQAAQRAGVPVRPADVNVSRWDNHLETGDDGCLTAKLAEQLEWTPAPLPAGGVVFFTSHAPHKSGRNETDQSRRSLYVTYNRASEGDLRGAYYESRRREMEQQRASGQSKELRLSTIGHFQGKGVS